jgi:hypothetical protein
MVYVPDQVRTMNLFIDIDGVLLGKSPKTRSIVLANYAKEFLVYALQNFNCYWLTTHCKGSTETVIGYLKPYVDEEVMLLIRKIKPTNFKTFKTEALFGDFYWVDDQPTAYEILYLEENDLLNRWLQVNTRQSFDSLMDLIKFLKACDVTDQTF